MAAKEFGSNTQPLPGSVGANTYQTFHNGHQLDDEEDSEDDLRTAGDGRIGIDKRALYEPESFLKRAQRAVLTPRCLCYMACGAFLCILLVALIATIVKPQALCHCPINGTTGGLLSVTLTNNVTTNTTGQLPDIITSNVTASTNTTLLPLLTADGKPFPWNDIRLPKDVIPINYSLRIHPSLATRRQAGTVNITFRVEKPVKFVVLHAKNLNLSAVHLVGGTGAKVVRTLEHEAREQLYVEFDKKLPDNENHVLAVSWVGHMLENMEGLYISSYRTAAGEERLIATTHFESTAARAAFPCFDEPALKATFRVSIVHTANRTALSNMPLSSTEKLPDSDLVVDHFDTTVRMSTYLLAFIVCDFDKISAVTEGGVNVSVYTPPDQISQATFALDVAVKALDYFNSFFGIPYPLPKQDLVAIPDFSAGAMENWGLTTYRDTSILADLNTTSPGKLQIVIITIVHELAHQWFGNLVTMKWWNDLWLNEGFATFMENQGADAIKPDWKLMDQFVRDKTQSALQLDSLISSHPITVDVNDPKQIASIFDDISYKKGGAILYMLQGCLGKTTLNKGLQAYLEAFQYSNAETEDLWKILSKASKKLDKSPVDVEKMMDTWTSQMGFPLVTISRRGKSIHASQQRYLVGSNGTTQDVKNPDQESKYGYKWIIPLTCVTDKDPQTSTFYWMNLDDVDFDIESDVKWIKCNSNQTGYYRVTYSDDIWRNLVAALKTNHQIFSAADRASLLDDAFSLSRNNLLDPRIPLEMTEYLVNETEYIPWVVALDHLVNYKHNLNERPCYIHLKKYMRDLLTPMAKEIGWEDTGSQMQRLLRPNILSNSISSDNEVQKEEAVRLFQAWKVNGTSIPVALRGVVFSTGIHYGTYEDWQHCWQYYQTTPLPSEQSTMRAALSSSQDPWVLSQYLDFSMQKDKIKPQNTNTILATVAGNPIGRDLAWRFVRSHWSEILKSHGSSSFILADILSAVTSPYNTIFDLHEIEAFFDNNDVGSGMRAVKNSMEKVKSNIRWLAHNEKLVEGWLRNRTTSVK